MQNQTKAGMALFVTIIALLTYTYIAFMGTEYMVEGDHAKAIGLSLLFVVLLTWGLRTMCKSKASRNKRRGLPLEIAAIGVTFGTLLAGSIPFNHFLYVADHQEAVQSSIQTITRCVGETDSLYADYADTRLRRYNQLLYKEKYKANKRKAMTQSLRRHLLPEGIDSVRRERQEWLSTVKSGSVWNVSTPRNVHYITKAGEEWTKQYETISNLMYKGEQCEPFSTETATSSASVAAELAYLSQPSLHPDNRSVTVTLLCCLLVLTTYLHIRRPKSKFSGSHR